MLVDRSRQKLTYLNNPFFRQIFSKTSAAAYAIPLHQRDVSLRSEVLREAGQGGFKASESDLRGVRFSNMNRKAGYADQHIRPFAFHASDQALSTSALTFGWMGIKAIEDPTQIR